MVVTKGKARMRFAQIAASPKKHACALRRLRLHPKSLRLKSRLIKVSIKIVISTFYLYSRTSSKKFFKVLLRFYFHLFLIMEQFEASFVMTYYYIDVKSRNLQHPYSF
jgi:hypothetical protein